MVPGMTERERLIANAQRRDWLADTMVSPARMFCLSDRAATSGRWRSVPSSGNWRTDQKLARLLGLPGSLQWRVHGVPVWLACGCFVIATQARSSLRGALLRPNRDSPTLS